MFTFAQESEKVQHLLLALDTAVEETAVDSYDLGRRICRILESGLCPEHDARVLRRIEEGIRSQRSLVRAIRGDVAALLDRI